MTHDPSKCHAEVSVVRDKVRCSVGSFNQGTVSLRISFSKKYIIQSKGSTKKKSDAKHFLTAPAVKILSSKKWLERCLAESIPEKSCSKGAYPKPKPEEDLGFCSCKWKYLVD